MHMAGRLRIVKILAYLIVLGGIIAAPRAAHAQSGPVYAHMSWDIPDPATQPRTVRFTVTTAWRNTALDQFTTLTFDDLSSDIPRSGTQIGLQHNLDGNVYIVRRYVVSHTYAADGLYVPSITECCRISSIQDPLGLSTAILFSVLPIASGNGDSASPIAAAVPFIHLQAGGQRTFDVPMADRDGDPVSCRRLENGESGTLPPILPGSLTSPSVATMGNICRVTWDVTAAVAGQRFHFPMAVDSTHPGSAASTVVIDFNVEIVGSAVPSVTPALAASGSIKNTLVGASVDATITGNWPDAVAATAGTIGLPTAATFSPVPGSANPGTAPLSMSFEWTPGAADTNALYWVPIVYTLPSHISGVGFLGIDVDTCPVCNGGTPICDVTTRSCRPCVASDCSGSTPVCSASGACAVCTVDSGVSGGNACASSTAPVCKSDGTCGTCASDTDCTGGNHAGPFCNPNTNACSSTCFNDAQCGVGNWCNDLAAPGMGGTCQSKTVNGTMIPGGTCSMALGTRACLSGVCETSDNGCGYLNGPSGGACSGASVCRSGACGSDMHCGLVNGQGTCSGSNAMTICRSGACNLATTTCGGLNTTACTTANQCASNYCGTNHLCGGASGEGPCGPMNAVMFCQSGACSANAMVCVPVGGCAVDDDCATGMWCDSATFSCTAKVANGAMVPTVVGHAPPLTGLCTTAAAVAVCASGVCDADNNCGYGDGHACAVSTECRTPSTCNRSNKCGAIGSGDPDADGLTDSAEGMLGLDPDNGDTDGDGIKDGDELGGDGVYNAGVDTDPLDTDTDDDGLSDNTEKTGANLLHGTLTNPINFDTDADGLPDGLEVGVVAPVAGGTSTPNGIAFRGTNIGSTNFKIDSDAGTTTNPTDDDSDNDNIKDGTEDANANGKVENTIGGRGGAAGSGETNPSDDDTDGDTLLDGAETGADGVYTPGTDSNPLDTDTDDGGATDGAERGADMTDPLNVLDDKIDTDTDGVTDPIESMVLHTDPSDADTDDDGLLDGQEVGGDGAYNSGMDTNPLDADTDDDGLKDGDERNGTGPNALPGGSKVTNPLAVDSDSDGLRDGLELGVTVGVAGGASMPGGIMFTGTAMTFVADAEPASKTDPADADTDNDGLPDGVEDANHDGSTVGTIGGKGTMGSGETDPGRADTDNDGLSDGQETGTDGDYDQGTDTNPLDSDTDDGGVSDGAEMLTDHTNPLNALDDNIDTDGDGVSDPTERGLGTDPTKTDTDGDGIADNVELSMTAGTAPYTRVDSDSDGTPDVLDSDADNDGLSDGDEAAGNGGSLDTDGDGVPNYRDMDDDGDGISSKDELSDVQAGRASDDVDGDGKKNWLDDDANGNGKKDGLDGRGDGDGDGVPDYLDGNYSQPSAGGGGIGCSVVGRGARAHVGDAPGWLMLGAIALGMAREWFGRARRRRQKETTSL